MEFFSHLDSKLYICKLVKKNEKSNVYFLNFDYFRVGQNIARKTKAYNSTAATLASEDDQSTARLDEVEKPERRQAWEDEGEQDQDIGLV